MTTTILPSKEHCIYPGEYIPLPRVKELVGKIKTRVKQHLSNQLLSHDEFEDCFKMDMQVAGIKREDILIYINNNILSIVLMGRTSEHVKNKLEVQKSDNDFIEQHLLLPTNADIEFISAIYNDGVLHLHIPKGEQIRGEIIREVVIY